MRDFLLKFKNSLDSKMVAGELSTWKKVFASNLCDVWHLKNADKGKCDWVVQDVVDGSFKNFSVNRLGVPVCHCFTQCVIILV